MSREAYESNLESIFAIFDTKQKGYLTVEGFSNALEALQLKFNTDEVDALFFAFDPKDTGRINYRSFVEFCSKDHVDANCKAVRQAIVLYVSEVQTHYTDTDDEMETMATDDLLSSEFVETPGVENVKEGMLIEVQKNGVWSKAQVAEERYDEAGSFLVIKPEIEKQILMVRNIPEKVRPVGGPDIGGDETPESGDDPYVREEYDISDDDVRAGDILNAFEDDFYELEIDLMDARYREESTQSWEEEDDIALMNAAVNQQIAVEAMNRFQHLQDQRRRNRNGKSVRFHSDVVEDHRPSLTQKEKWVRNEKINSKRKLLQQLVRTTPTDVKKKLDTMSRKQYTRPQHREQPNILMSLGDKVVSNTGRRKNSPPRAKTRRLTHPSSQSNRRTKDGRRPFTVEKTSPIKSRKSEQPKSILKREVIVGVPPKHIAGPKQQRLQGDSAVIVGMPASHLRTKVRSTQTKRRAASPLRKPSPPKKKAVQGGSPKNSKRVVTATDNKLVISRIFDDSSPERPRTDRRRKDFRTTKMRVLTTNDDRKIVDSSDIVDEDDEKVSEIIMNRARGMNMNEDIWQDRPLSDSSTTGYDPQWHTRKRMSVDRDSINREVDDILSQRKKLLNEEKLLTGLRFQAARKANSDRSSSASVSSFERTSKRRTYNDSFGTLTKKEKRRFMNRSLPTLSTVQQEPPVENVPYNPPLPQPVTTKRMTNGVKRNAHSKGKITNGDFAAVKRKNGVSVRRRQLDPSRARMKDEFRKRLREERKAIEFEDFLKRVNR